MEENPKSKVHDPMLDRPDFAAALGMIVSQASYLETQLAELFCHITGTDPERGELIYWSFPTFDQRRRLMEIILREVDLPFKQKAKAIIRRAKKFLTFRNSSVHNLWTLANSDDSPMDRITVNLIRNSKPTVVRVKLRQMREAVETAVAINRDLAQLIWEIEYE